MGYFDFDARKPYGRQITEALARRDMEPCLDEEWQVHGPHGVDFPQPVFIGYARRRGEDDKRILVTVYPHAVYEIEDGNDRRWWDTRSDYLRRIPVRKK